MRRVASWVVGLGVVAVCAGAGIGEVRAGQEKNVEASNGWVKTPAAGETTAAAFVAVDNPTQYDIYLTSAVTDVAGKVEFRDKSGSGDAQGQVKKTISVPAFGSLAMDPKGVYLLLTDLKRPLKDGDMVSLTLTTDGGTTLKVSAAVRKE
jgi:copper(I)-binding protein